MDSNPASSTTLWWTMGSGNQEYGKAYASYCWATETNYKEFFLVLHQVETVMNSRPLTPLSSDPNDLTPAHFFIGGLLHGRR